MFTPYVMWSFPLLFFTYQFVLRLWPGLMMQQIMSQFSIDATHFGLLAAFYYYGYAGMQIPIAILLERWGARRVVTLFATVCGLAAFLFTTTHYFYLAVLSRFLIGVGSAAGFLCVSKVVSEWFSKEQYSRMIGLSFTVGLLGAIYGGKPIGLLIEKHDWQTVAYGIAFVALLIALAAGLWMRPSKNKAPVENAFNWSSLQAVITSPAIWLLAIANLLMVGCLEGFADVWGVPYVMTACGFSKTTAAGLLSCIFFGMLPGGPLLAFFSKKWGNYAVISVCGLGMSSLFVLLLTQQWHTPWVLGLIFLAIGIMSCYQVLVFAAGSELVSAQHLGVCVAFLNCMNMLGGSFFHTLIGHAMDLFWTGTTTSTGMHQYTLHAYHYALSIIPLCASLGALIVLYLRQRTLSNFSLQVEAG